MILLSQLKGQRVIAHDNAQMQGSVRRLLLNAAEARITAIEVEGVSDGRTIVEWQSIFGIGEAAINLQSAEHRRGPLDEAEQALLNGQLDLDGKLVLDETGDAVGKLEDLGFDEVSGQVSELHVQGHALPVERILALGPYALIVPATGTPD